MNKRQKYDNTIQYELSIYDIYNIGNYYYKLKDYNNVISIYSKIFNNDDTNIEINKVLNTILLQLGSAYYKLNNFVKCIKLYNLIDINHIYDIENYDFYEDIDIKLQEKNNNINIIKIYLLALCSKKLMLHDDTILYFNKCISYIKNKNENKSEDNILLDYIYNHLIELYEKKQLNNFDEKEINQLLDIYKIKNKYIKVLEILKKNNNQIEINNYIKNILNDVYIFMLDNENIDEIFEYFEILTDDDIIFLAKKYHDLYKPENIKKLINNNYKIQKLETKIIILYNLLQCDYNNIKHCENIFKIYEKLNDDEKNENILKIIESTKSYYNQLISIHICKNEINNIKFSNFYKYLDRSNLDIINNEYCKYLSLKNTFKNIESTIDKCVICLSDENEIITLNCHNTHIICYECYLKINLCPMCRDKIYK
jgi:hypothetical protein